MRRLPEVWFVLAAACGHPDGAPVAATHAPAPPPGPPAEPVVAADDELAPGLAVLRLPLPGGAPDDGIDVIRADPARFRLRVLTASHDGSSHPAPDWREMFHLAAVTNAGMFHGDGAPVGLIVEDGATIGADNPKFGGVIAFEPRDPHDPAAIVTEASLVARGDAGELRRVGSYETGFWENDDNRAFWWLPNVLALAPR